MVWIDWAMISVLGISSVISFRRGFVKEALSLVIWLLALVIASVLSPTLSPLLAAYLEQPSLRQLAAFAMLFIGTLLVGAVVKSLFSKVIKMTGLSGTDRFLGMFFGMARGLIIIMVLLIYIPQLLTVEADSWWQQSVLIPYFIQFEGDFRALMASIYTLISGWFVVSEPV
ncbi:MAG: CvpA family protein [Cellvibrionaceae bacterium]|nr:CvpA family protein [Cellvibrionaceae bacterium]